MPTSEWIELKKCESAEEFVEYLRPTRAHWGKGRLVSEWLFRGDRDASRRNLPSAWRELKPQYKAIHDRLIASAHFNAFILRWGPSNPPFDVAYRPEWDALAEDVKLNRIKKYLGRCVFEMLLIQDFWQIANSVGHRIAPPYWIKVRSSLSSSIAMLMGNRYETFESLIVAAAQHHGIPTRLLDWTTRPLVAAFFAADGAKADEICVWAVLRNAAQRAGLSEVRIDRHELPFLHAQSGCFLWAPAAHYEFSKTGEWPSQEEMLVNSADDQTVFPYVRKITLPQPHAHKLVELLWREEISRAHLMPTFDSVAESVRSSFTWRDDWN